MPYYRWSGIDLAGRIHKGTLFGRQVPDVAAVLLTRRIGLIKARKRYFWTNGRVRAAQAGYLAHLARLLTAHVRLYQALVIVSNAIEAKYSKMVWADITQAIAEGQHLAQAVTPHTELFDQLTCAVITSSQETGNLGPSIAKLAEHQLAMQSLQQKVKAALMLPVVTFIFFLAVLLAMLIGIVPRFEQFFSAFNEPLPQVTRGLLALSAVVRHHWIMLLSLLGSGCLAFFAGLKTAPGQRLGDELLVRFSGTRKLMLYIARAKLMHTLSMLTKGAVPLAQALAIAQDSFARGLLHADITHLKSAVISGEPLSQSLTGTRLCNDAELQALVIVGESSGSLPAMLETAAQLYQERMYTMLTTLISWIQPLLLVFLGLCIAGLVCALYIPIFTLSTVVH